MNTKISLSFNPVWLVCLTLFTCLTAVSYSVAEAQTSTSTPSSIFLQMSKIVSPAHFPGVLNEGDFSFHITGPGGSFDIAHGGVVEIDTVGQYEITESYNGNDPVGFDPEDWTVYWVGDLCEGPTDVPATDPGMILITESDFGRFNSNNPARCNAENQYYPNDEDNSGGNGSATSTLRVVKVVVGTSTPPTNFSFNVNGGSSVAFEADGVNELEVATGTYQVAEVGTTTGFSVSYSNNCASLAVGAGETGTCTITNTWNGDNGGGGNGTSTIQYRIEGYVWHDENEDKDKEETEDFLESWVVSITNGTTTATTTTNSAGYYFFDVEAGTWTISEVLQEDWFMSYPTTPGGVHVVTVPQEEPEEITLFFPLNLFFKVAQAAVVETYSGYNFGNFQGGRGGGGNGGDDDDDSSGGGGNRSGGGNNNGGTPQILGNQVSLMPLGAAQGGFGGSSLALPSFLAFLWPALAWLGF
jgi:hypothetical protein